MSHCACVVALLVSRSLLLLTRLLTLRDGTAETDDRERILGIRNGGYYPPFFPHHPHFSPSTSHKQKDAYPHLRRLLYIYQSSLLQDDPFQLCSLLIPAQLRTTLLRTQGSTSRVLCMYYISCSFISFFKLLSELYKPRLRHNR